MTQNHHSKVVGLQTRGGVNQGRADGSFYFRVRRGIAEWLDSIICLGLILAAMGCDGTLDAGRNIQRGLLPVDEHNPVIIANDAWSDNWAGEFGVLLANNGGSPLVGLIVNASLYWPDLNANVTECDDFVLAARASGLKHVPDVTMGASSPLTVPANQKIESTVPPDSPGAQLIVDLSRRLSLPGQPLVVVTGSQLTDLAGAYLIDPTVVDRVTVVAALGSYSAPKGLMTGPNGDLDPWADWIVAQRFRYIQVTVLYDQMGDVTADDVENLPKNAFRDWINAKLARGNLSTMANAADQLAVLAAGLPSFVTTVDRCSPDTSAGFNSPQGQGPPLVPGVTGVTGNVLLVTQVATSLVRTKLWQMLQDSRIFGGS
jgi:hypothetical protein